MLTQQLDPANPALGAGIAMRVRSDLDERRLRAARQSSARGSAPPCTVYGGRALNRVLAGLAHASYDLSRQANRFAAIKLGPADCVVALAAHRICAGEESLRLWLSAARATYEGAAVMQLPPPPCAGWTPTLAGGRYGSLADPFRATWESATSLSPLQTAAANPLKGARSDLSGGQSGLICGFARRSPSVGIGTFGRSNVDSAGESASASGCSLRTAVGRASDSFLLAPLPARCAFQLSWPAEHERAVSETRNLPPNSGLSPRIGSAGERRSDHVSENPLGRDVSMSGTDDRRGSRDTRARTRSAVRPNS